MAIGNWGTGLIFEVSDSNILTFNNFSRNVTSTWAAHSRVGLKDRSEFLRPGLQKIQFDVELNAEYGVRPRTMLEYIERCVETGEVNILVIGGRRVGSNGWTITGSSEAWDVLLNRGEMVKARVTITMDEYV